ncbi:hypothetical protein [Sporosarcina highlanderae]|uniref:DUF4349 domain-containing protein n=1 Tax=Sporosarcina highlanderae TaxID=3035916 RepID=A0ABT8JN49_9BACL|nr:hypothetical protein [Sporosarcina highlanderae]MDN4606581.1 hypothetical protein [Sporosarcina highlanderae]
MKKRWVLFLVGVILFLSSLPLTVQMAMEKTHTAKMHNRYDLHIISHRYPPPKSTFLYKDHTVKVEETPIDKESYTDPWKYTIAFADLSVVVNEEQIDKLEQYPIRIEEEGLARYYGNISFIILKDKRRDEEKLYMILKKTNDPIEVGINIDPMMLTYDLYSINEAGHLEGESFSFTNRNALQTLILNNSGASPFAIGYYTDAWNWMPSILFPFIFPFFSFFVGVFLMIRFLPFKRRKQT